MAAVVKDIVDGSTVTQDGTGTSAVRMFHVSGIEGSASNKLLAIMKHPDVGQLGERHPAFSELFCTDRSINFMDADNARVSCRYAIPRADRGDLPEGSKGDVTVPSDDVTGQGSTDQGTISVSATGSDISTDLDINGRQMIVAHNVRFDTGQAISTDEFGRTRREFVEKRNEQVQTAEISRPSLILRVTRIEKGSPDAKARYFVGSVNNKAIEGDPPHSWLCTRIDGTSNDGGDQYSVTYEFQYNRDLWVFVGIWIDPATQLPVPSKDFNTQEEFKLFRVYEERDFAPLGIKFKGVVGGDLAEDLETKRQKVQVRERGSGLNIEFTVETDELFK